MLAKVAVQCNEQMQNATQPHAQENAHASITQHVSAFAKENAWHSALNSRSTKRRPITRGTSFGAYLASHPKHAADRMDIASTNRAPRLMLAAGHCSAICKAARGV